MDEHKGTKLGFSADLPIVNSDSGPETDYQACDTWEKILETPRPRNPALDDTFLRTETPSSLTQQEVDGLQGLEQRMVAAIRLAKDIEEGHILGFEVPGYRPHTHAEVRKGKDGTIETLLLGEFSPMFTFRDDWGALYVKNHEYDDFFKPLAEAFLDIKHILKVQLYDPAVCRHDSNLLRTAMFGTAAKLLTYFGKDPRTVTPVTIDAITEKKAVTPEYTPRYLGPANPLASQGVIVDPAAAYDPGVKKK